MGPLGITRPSLRRPHDPTLSEKFESDFGALAEEFHNPENSDFHNPENSEIHDARTSEEYRNPDQSGETGEAEDEELAFLDL